MSPVLFTVIYLLCVVMCLAIGTMLAWQLWSVAIGETAVESYDHEYYRKVASSRGEVCLETQMPPNLVLHLSQTFQNSYDLGFALSLLVAPSSLLSHFYRKSKNLELFLNIGIDG
jgi:palmitoyltransferase